MSTCAEILASTQGDAGIGRGVPPADLRPGDRSAWSDGRTDGVALVGDAAVGREFRDRIELPELLIRSTFGAPAAVRATPPLVVAGDAPAPFLVERVLHVHRCSFRLRHFRIDIESPILLLVRDAAATDPEIAKLRATMDSDRLKRMHVNARYLQERGYLRKEVTMQQAAEMLWTYSSAEVYEPPDGA